MRLARNSQRCRPPGSPPASVRRPLRSSQLVQQRVCVLQIGGVEPLGEPAIDRRQQVARLPPPSLLAPQPRQANGGPQLMAFRLLSPRNRQRRLQGILVENLRSAAMLNLSKAGATSIQC